MNELVTRQQERGLAISTETKELIQSSLADSTLKRYQRLSKQIEAWLNGQILTDGRLADYITELHAEGKSPATLAQVVAAANWLAKNHGIEIVGEITSKTLAGIRREGKERGKGQVDGVEREEMLRVVTLAEADKTIAGLRDAALIRLMSDYLLRISEAVAVNVGDLYKNTLRIRSSKTDQEGRGEVLFVGGPTLKLINRYCTRGEIQSGALFRHIRRGDHVQSGRLTTVSARRIIQARAKAAGVEGFISGHSLRIGSAVSLAQAGASVVDMQNAGRWKSPQMPAHHTLLYTGGFGSLIRWISCRIARLKPAPALNPFLHPNTQYPTKGVGATRTPLARMVGGVVSPKNNTPMPAIASSVY